jgi:GT2 family glycosyltransferase
MDLSIIIINWKSVAYLRPCVRSIQENTHSLEYEVVVVDNASDDGCGEMLANEFPGVRFIQSGSNLGFSRGNNLGGRHSSGDNLCFLNPDTEIKGDALKTMLDVLRTANGAGAVGCRLLNGDGSLQTSCIQSFPTLLNQSLDADLLYRVWPRCPLWGIAPLYDDETRPSPVQVISGACLMMKRTVFDSIGGFSEDYFMYAEDADLCYAAHKRGWTNYYVPTASVIHYGGGSSSQSVWRLTPNVQKRESMYRFFEKHYGSSCASRYRMLIGWAARIRIGLMFFARTQRGSMEKWSGILRWAKGAQ